MGYMTSSTETPDSGDAQRVEPGWSTALARRVAGEVRYWREKRGISAVQLAKRTAELGFHLPRSVIANLENNRRATVSVAELLVLAAALDVPPVLLVVPVGRTSAVEVLPDTSTSPWRARGWIHGATEPEYSGFSAAAWQLGRRAIVLYDVHRYLVREHQQIERRIRQMADQEHLVVGEIVADDLRFGRGALGDFVTELTYSVDRLRAHRNLIKAEGFELPELPPGIAVALKEIAPSGRHRRGSDDIEASEGLLAPIVYEQLRASVPPIVEDDDNRDRH